MKTPKSIGELLAQPDTEEEVYTSEKRRRYARAQKGWYSRSGHTFDFIYLIRKWDQIVGKLLAQNTIPHKIIKNTLIIMTKHSVFASELSFMGPQIIQKIEEHVPELEGKIKKVKFSHANYSWEEFQNASFQKANKKPQVQKLHPFSPEFRIRKAKAQKLFSDIEDEEIKELLEKLFIENN